MTQQRCTWAEGSPLPTIAYAWMQAAGIVNDHVPACFRRSEILAIAQAR